MEQSFEESIPIPVIVAGFVIFITLAQLLRRYLRKRHLTQQGQLPLSGTRIRPIEERLAANRAWASGQIRSGGRGFTVILWTATIAWNLTLGVSFIQTLPNPDIPIPAKILLGILSLGGFVFAYFAVRSTLQRLRFGESWCCIRGKAGVLGQKMEGTIRTTNEVTPTGDYAIQLQCVESYTTGSGKNRRTESRIHFETKQSVPSQGKNSQVGIPFCFDLPEYPLETGYQLARGSVNWQLRVTAPVKGVDYSAMFIVPVFKVE